MFKTVPSLRLPLWLLLAGYLGQVGVCHAQSKTMTIAELPPPPPVPAASSLPDSFDNLTPLSIPPSSNIPTFEPTQATPNIPPTPVFPEYNFQAPQPTPNAVNNEVTAPPQPTDKQIPFYRVEVIADDISVLSEVKKVEPLAFVQQQQGVIYAGLFIEQQKAQQRVQQLASQGLSAQVVPVSYSVSQSYDIPVQR